VGGGGGGARGSFGGVFFLLFWGGWGGRGPRPPPPPPLPSVQVCRATPLGWHAADPAPVRLTAGHHPRVTRHTCGRWQLRRRAARRARRVTVSRGVGRGSGGAPGVDESDGDRTVRLYSSPLVFFERAPPHTRWGNLLSGGQRRHKDSRAFRRPVGRREIVDPSTGFGRRCKHTGPGSMDCRGLCNEPEW